MRRGFVVDTSLMVDWCLWELADHGPPGLREKAAQRLSVLRLREYLDSLNEHLAAAAHVATLPTAVEVGFTIYRLVSSDRGPHFGPRIVQSTFEFFDRFCPLPVERIGRSRLQPGVAKRFGFPDAALVAAASRDRPLLLTDHALWEWCLDHNVPAVRFHEGELSPLD